MSINKTQIDWAKNPDGTQGYTWNPITGCLNGCEYCYARRLANTRLKERYLANENICRRPHAVEGRDPAALADPFFPRFWPERINHIFCSSKGELGIFACDMSDLFGIGIPEEWTRAVLDAIKIAEQHRFYLLTKQPQNLPQWSPFPDNCWVGVTATNDKSYREAIVALYQIEAKTKYLSLEPLLERISFSPTWELDAPPRALDWLIIGALTGTKQELLPLHHKTSLVMVKLNGNRWSLQPQIEWVSEIVEAADKAGIPVFLKNNLKSLLPTDEPFYNYYQPQQDGVAWGRLKQEMPN